MTLTLAELDQIVKTLPIGYYIGRNVKMTADGSSNCSYYDPMNDQICISLMQVNTALEQLTDTNCTEEIVRTVTYHEVSHAFLTPTTMKMNRVLNIFEDERIETILRKYYMNTNFRKCVKLINKYDGSMPTDAESAFYHLVRYREGAQNWLNRVAELIEKYKQLNRNTDYCDVYDYMHDVHQLHDEFIAEWNNMNASNADQPQDQECAGNQNGEQAECTEQTATESANQSADKTDDDENAEQVQTDVQAEAQDDQSESDTETETFDPTFVKEMIKSVADTYNDAKIVTDIQRILQRISKSNSKNGSAINSYSGVFNARSADREDCKFFVQQNRLGHVKAFSKTHLNLFIDRSGSFRSSEETANKLLYALQLFERSNPNFSFTLIVCGSGEEICEKDKRELHCGGGNYLDEKIFDIFKQVQVAGQDNHNIVLFDGDAFSNCSHGRYYWSNFGAFNNSKTTIISDPENERAIKMYAKSAKIVITYDYVNELIMNVMNALQALSR